MALVLYDFQLGGAIFEQGTDEIQSAFKFAMLNHNLNVSSRRFELQAYVDVINTADAFKLSRLSDQKNFLFRTETNSSWIRSVIEDGHTKNSPETEFAKLLATDDCRLMSVCAADNG
ncbi:hypothetical protein pipiens_004558 [Culex pipiens pipiens]|uniref:Uncharacterized protein n=1 Tax=Culex pipiens pipiens TaxID=38569 RepID=A0ABD1CIH3_CULPP